MNKINKKIFWIIGLIAFYLIFSNTATPQGLTTQGYVQLVLMVTAVIAWTVEVVPIAVGALVFTFLMPIVGTASLPTTLANWVNTTVFFVLAMFIVANALDASGLAKRVSLYFINLSKGNAQRLLFYFMAVSSLTSFVIADVPVIAMMVPIALSVLKQNGCEPLKSNYGKAMMLGLAFAALIGGIGTPAGSAMNVLAIELMKKVGGINITFIQWTLIGAPMAIILTPIAWKVVTWVFPSEIKEIQGMDVFRKDYKALGRLSKKEIQFLVIMIITIGFWLTDSIHKVNIAVISTFAAAAFFLPGIEMIKWEEVKQKIGWDVVILNGSAPALGLTLAQLGAATWISSIVFGRFSGVNSITMIAVVAIFTILIHLLVPVNPAIIAVFIPAVIVFANQNGIAPALLAIPLAFTVSAAFLLPLDPVALVAYSSGYFKMPDMAKPGILLSVAWVVVAIICMYFIARPLGII